MILDVMESIGKALFLEFGDAYDIYTEHVTQGMTVPCFMVEHLGTSYRNMPRTDGLHVMQDSRYRVAYIASTPDVTHEGYALTERMLKCLNTFYTKEHGYVRPRFKDINVRNDIIDFRFRIITELWEELDKTKMQILEQVDTGVKSSG